MNRRIAIVGSGGFATEIRTLISLRRYEFAGYIDMESADKKKNSIIGHEKNIVDLISDYNFKMCFIAVGDIKVRKRLSLYFEDYKLNFPNLIISKSVHTKNIAVGTVIYPQAALMNDCDIGRFTIINSGVTLGHGTKIGNYCNINPGANLAGNICVGDSTMIGIGATIKENINIGKNVIIGAGSVVLNDIPNNKTAFGVPAVVQD